MKILYITNGYPPHRWAGTETYTAGIASEFSKRGHQPKILCIGNWDTGDSYFNGYVEDVVESVPVRRLNVNWKKSPDPFSYLYNNPVVEKHLTEYIEEEKPDLVHTTSCETLSASVLGVIKKARIPSVITLTDFWFLCPRINLLRSDGMNCDGATHPWQCLKCQLLKSKVYRWPKFFLPEKIIMQLLTKLSKYPKITRQHGLRGMAGEIEKRKEFLMHAIRLPDVRITASLFVKEIYHKNHVDAIRVIPYGHDLAWLSDYNGKSKSNTLRIGFIGQINNAKGVHLLIEAVNSINMTHKEKIELSIYGNTNHDVKYSALLKSLASNQANITFKGIYQHERSAEVFSNIDVLVVPSIWYDFPLIIHEAFATQTPVIATNLGGMAETVIDGVNGLLFERGNIEQLVVQIRRLVDEPNLYDRLKAGITPIVQMSEHIDRLNAIYHDLLNTQSIS
jgi:glycosyltransferase involved in cell wall biosynthesis